MAWIPGRRAATQALEAPYEDVPEHLATPLWAWVKAFLDSDADLVKMLGIELRLAIADPSQGYASHSRAVGHVLTKGRADGGFLLDVVEYILQHRCAANVYRGDYESAEELGAILELANSIYGVRSDAGGLELRTLPEVKQQVETVVSAATGSARDHLTNAWNEAYGRVHDPVKSYSESIKAVEAAFAPLVSPQNSRQTLGTMISDLRNSPAKWQFVIADGTNSDGVGTVLSMMRVIWEGQTSRHGGVNPTRDETLDEAQGAVHLAATLVQFAVSGAFSLV